MTRTLLATLHATQVTRWWPRALKRGRCRFTSWQPATQIATATIQPRQRSCSPIPDTRTFWSHAGVCVTYLPCLAPSPPGCNAAAVGTMVPIPPRACQCLCRVLTVPPRTHLCSCCHVLPSSEDGTIRQLDLRCGGSSACVVLAQLVHCAVMLEVNSICAPSHRPWLLAAGASDEQLRVYDRRMMMKPSGAGGQQDMYRAQVCGGQVGTMLHLLHLPPLAPPPPGSVCSI